VTGSEGLPARGYSWEPFEANNTAAVRHGAWSARLVAPEAAQLEREAREDPSWPARLNEGRWSGTVADLFWTEAQINRMRAKMSDEDLDVLLTEVTETDGEEQASKGRVSRRSTTRRRGVPLESLLRLMAHALALRKELGLTPLSQARLGKDRAATELSLVELLTREREAYEAAQEAEEATDADG